MKTLKIRSNFRSECFSCFTTTTTTPGAQKEKLQKSIVVVIHKRGLSRPHLTKMSTNSDEKAIRELNEESNGQDSNVSQALLQPSPTRNASGVANVIVNPMQNG